MPPLLSSVKTQKCQINSNIDPLVRKKQTAEGEGGGGEGEMDFLRKKEKKRRFVELAGS